MDYIEFLTALGENELVSLLINADIDMISVFKDKYQRLLKEYIYVGGMPEVVNSYVTSKDYNEVRKIQIELLKSYENDFSKHVPKNELPKVIQIWNNFNSQLARENKKFIFGAIKESARASEYENAINWLVETGLLYKINRVNDAKIPLEGYIDYSAFKLYFLDVGLLSAKNSMGTQIILEGNEIFKEYKGALTEQYVLEQIKSNYDIPINYWTNKTATSEVDFMVQFMDTIIPIEVKSGENLHSKSLKVFVDKYNTKNNIRTSMTDYKKEEWLVNIPLYLIGNFDKYI